MALWVPGFERVTLPDSPDGGWYDEYKHPKFGWHTWEGYSLAGAEAAFRKYPPHIAVSFELGVRRQYIDLARHAYAFAGSDSDDSYVIQVEVAGYAGESQDWLQSKLKWLGEMVVRPITAIIVPVGFHGQGAGFILASDDSPIRLTTSELDGFAGHLGHQHMPSPDEHWDPGKLPISRILDYAKTATPVGEEDDMQFFFRFPASKRLWMGNGFHYREVSDEDVKDFQAMSGGKIPELWLADKQVERMQRIGP
jgi:hypothetical protein